MAAHDTTVEPAIQNVTLDHILQTGIAPVEAQIFYAQLQLALSEVGHSPVATWCRVSQELLKPQHPESLHRLMYYSIYKNWDSAKLGPPIAWMPTEESARETNLGRLMEAHAKQFLGLAYRSPIESFSAFHRFSVEHLEMYYPLVFEELSLHFHVQPRCIFDNTNKTRPGGTWLPGAVINTAESCLLPKASRGKTDDTKAIVWRDEGCDDSPLQSMTLAELRVLVNGMAHALDALGFEKGDSIAISMPMDKNSIVIYLGIILAGYVVVSIAESYAIPEIAARLSLSKAKAIFTQDYILRGGKRLPLYSRIVDAQSPMAIVLPADGRDLSIRLRGIDISWNNFLSRTSLLSRPWKYQAMEQPVEAYTNILFSSGTTGKPKAIPWSHLQPIRIGAETWALMDLRVGDVLVCPTSLGWMVGPVLIYSCLLNGATIGIYNGSPLDRGFGKFVQDAHATILATVPSMVKTWRKTSCMDGLNWSSVRYFTSAGEASSVGDNLWLSAKAGYKPVLDICGGTELGTAFVHGCLLQPQAFAMFSTPSMTTHFVLLDEQKRPYPDDQPCIGEIALMPMLGSSHTLLNADHDEVYFKGMPFYKGMQLRRQDDLFERTVGGFYKAHGRIDDTMNLGGIKTSSIEIECVCNSSHEQVIETAAISVPSADSGPDQLVIFVVLKEGTSEISVDTLNMAFSKAIRTNLNPLFKVNSIVVVTEFPRTPTNKVMRRVLRSQFLQATHTRHSKL
eukprot:c22108_g1_i1 orf=499-2703(-)